MFDCATAAFMKRRSRMAEVIAAVPTAAHAAWRMNSRRARTETFLFSISLFLDGEIGRGVDLVDQCADALAHLGGGRRRAVAEVDGVGDVVHDVGFCARRQLAREQQRVERINETRNSGGRSE